ncbi:MAG: hypothetical protein ACYTGC_00400 [Planctomycetota bacterium]|jgi:hypothetical protein
MAATAKTQQQIDDLVTQATEALERGHFFEAEHLSLKAVGAAHHELDYARLIPAIDGLRDARLGRYQQAVDVGTVTIVDSPVDEDMQVEAGCYLIQPPQVGADARRLRLAGMHQQVPIAVLCREPLTQLRLCPIVAICPGTTIRTQVDPPDDVEAPDLDWFIWAMEELGNWAIDSLDAGLDPTKRVDLLIDALTAIPEHAALHLAVSDACREALAVEADSPEKARKT